MIPRLRRTLTAATAVLVALVGLLVALAAPAAADPYPPSNPPTLSAAVYDPCSGASNVIGGTGFRAGETVVLTLDQTGEVGRTTVRADGTFQVTITVPLSERGSDRLSAHGLTSGITIGLKFDLPCVLGQSTTRIGGGSAGGGGLAYTGVAVGGVLLLAAVLLGTGAAFAVAGRRRRSTAVPH